MRDEKTVLNAGGAESRDAMPGRTFLDSLTVGIDALAVARSASPASMPRRTFLDSLTVRTVVDDLRVPASPAATLGMVENMDWGSKT